MSVKIESEKTVAEFRGFAKIPRLSRECTVTEKIDGTNACICITEDGEFMTGSRTRWISPESDNHGFSRWAYEHKDELMALGVGTHYGEWWGAGIQRGYGLDDKRLSLFNTSRWCLHGETAKNIPTSDPRIVRMQNTLPPCCHLVPVLYEGEFDTFLIDGLLREMRAQGSRAAPGFMRPEGVIIYHHAAGQYFKKTLEKDSVFKGKH